MLIKFRWRTAHDVRSLPRVLSWGRTDTREPSITDLYVLLPTGTVPYLGAAAASAKGAAIPQDRTDTRVLDTTELYVPPSPPRAGTVTRLGAAAASAKVGPSVGTEPTPGCRAPQSSTFHRLRWRALPQAGEGNGQGGLAVCNSRAPLAGDLV